jgi:uncharacterized protein
MPAIHLPAAKNRLQPWKNGLGVSRTIADFPQGAGFDSVLWQVGSTDIGVDCPFSDLPGLDRQFMVIEGAGVELTCVDAAGATTRKRIDQPCQPFSFRGDWRTSCRLLDGPVKVFNVMTRRGRYSAKVEIVSALDSARASSGETLLAVALPSLDAWILDGPASDVGRSVLVRIKKE